MAAQEAVSPFRSRQLVLFCTLSETLSYLGIIQVDD